MITRIRRLSAPRVAASLLLLTLVGCGSGGGAGPSDDKPVASASASPRASPSPTSSVNEDGTAKAGSKAKLGEPVLLRYEGGTKSGVLEVTVTGIEKGDKADVASLGLEGDAKKMTPYYVRATIKNAGKNDLSHAAVDPPGGLLGDGTAARQLLVIGTFAPCDSYPKTKKFPPGASYETCAPVFADPGTEVTGAAWTGQGYPDFPPSAGVTWTP
ncbi:hypothetical protein [Streptomyces caniscabiei]|uniref:Lipoprotein n=1 Tax=Streptomyces caniscabiei TaxID=2746961 RepID=A0ABU4MS22_9ACTN|nr:hypothetical protein [Streptomyces caniscabiei]MBE4738050.1 hypothetical protein [Streptomyces caniscabiei]MBE4756813.1 hypothetical protein [Streptomyces caniscabiei]MBE4773753.1 hypothetical protein [Streptomyces caniscabiei]MBE4785677.1 hypothetical protein [Streptomyces caniscabiei]MBE4797019.1 hypothetical protein [Streptomyces caniscabiei]